MTLKRPIKPKALISLVPMIDVMLILLVFFMVTSTYLNLDMIPAVRQQDQAQAPASDGQTASTLMIRLGSDGAAVIRGRAITDRDLERLLRQRLRDEPLTQVVVLPSGAATTQSLISVMDVATRAGVLRLRVIRLQARTGARP
ncbi:MAG: biopolymer transporter ExbD [Rhodobacteraceae bacterium]|nr:biopolymer transporter ExbD [Paracoccaceae bacterium]